MLPQEIPRLIKPESHLKMIRTRHTLSINSISQHKTSPPLKEDIINRLRHKMYIRDNLCVISDQEKIYIKSRVGYKKIIVIP